MRRYWAYQLAGWLGYSAVGITINLIGGASLQPLVIGHAVLVSCGIGLTHLLRDQIHRHRRPDEPISRLWPRLIVAGILISVVLAALVIGINLALTHGQWDLISVIALWWGMFLATGVWIVLYVRFSERHGHQLREGQLQVAFREAQLQALELQISPHFLFNVLNSIRALVELDPVRAQDMLTRLSHVLRHSLRRDNQHTVTLGSELEAVSDYLALETVRFADRLRASIIAEEGSAMCRIPPMILQTLVENAVKHGIGQTKSQADLSVQTSLDDRRLLIAVENSGKLVESRDDGTHVGLKNIRERLKLLYGDRASLRLQEKAGRVIATVAIPVDGYP